jgi:septal ring factor EnvC (AmiA/AmiB activator)
MTSVAIGGTVVAAITGMGVVLDRLASLRDQRSTRRIDDLTKQATDDRAFYEGRINRDKEQIDDLTQQLSDLDRRLHEALATERRQTQAADDHLSRKIDDVAAAAPGALPVVTINVDHGTVETNAKS